MPQMANITIKAANGTTDVVYTALSPSAGDKVQAVWRNETASPIAGLRPVFRLASQDNGARTARRVGGTFKYPYQDTDTKVTSTIPVEFSILVPLSVPDTVVAEAVAHATGLISSALLKDSMKAGYAPT